MHLESHHDAAAAAIPCLLPDLRPRTNLLPAHLATAIIPRRNVVAECTALPTPALLAEANALTSRMLAAGCDGRDFAVIVALVRRLREVSCG